MGKAIFGMCVVAVLSAGIWFQSQWTRHDTVWWQNEVTLTDLRSRLEVSRYRLEQLDTGFNPEALEAARLESALLTKSISEATAKRDDLAAHVQREIAGMESARKSIRDKLRANEVGTERAEFTISGGRSFTDVRIVSIDDGGVTFRHSLGSSRVSYADLTPAQRDAFAMEEAAARNAELAEQRNARAYESWLTAEVKLQQEKKEEVRESAVYSSYPRYSVPVSAGPVSYATAPPRTLSQTRLLGTQKVRLSRNWSGRYSSHPRANRFYYPPYRYQSARATLPKNSFVPAGLPPAYPKSSNTP